jgi:hypothetical protein
VTATAAGTTSNSTWGVTATTAATLLAPTSILNLVLMFVRVGEVRDFLRYFPGYRRSPKSCHEGNIRGEKKSVTSSLYHGERGKCNSSRSRPFLQEGV